MSHPMYTASYDFVTGLFTMAMSVGWYWLPFLLMGLLIAVVRWLNRAARGADTADHYDEEYIDLRGDLDRAGSAWRSRRR